MICSLGLLLAWYMYGCRQTATTEESSVVSPEIAAIETIQIDLSKLADYELTYPYEMHPRAYGAGDLQPYLDAMTGDIHFDKHHTGYKNKLNAAVENTEMQSKALFELFREISIYPEAVKNNGGGYYNHNLYWSVMSPEGGGEPEGKLAEAIVKYFDSFEEFRQKFSDEAKSKFASGWTWLIVNRHGNLEIASTSNHVNPIMDVSGKKGIPILVVDVWEHAYYLNYQNRRAEFVDGFWDVVNWKEVEKRYEEAISIVGA